MFVCVIVRAITAKLLNKNCYNLVSIYSAAPWKFFFRFLVFVSFVPEIDASVQEQENSVPVGDNLFKVVE